MDSVSTLFARTFLRSAYLDATTRNPVTTLLAVLNEHLTASTEATSGTGGLTITQQAGNGHSFTAVEAHGLKPVQYAGMIGELMDVYETCEADLIEAGNATPSDEEIKDEMIDRLRPVRASYTDRSCATL